MHSEPDRHLKPDYRLTGHAHTRPDPDTPEPIPVKLYLLSHISVNHLDAAMSESPPHAPLDTRTRRLVPKISVGRASVPLCLMRLFSLQGKLRQY